jgi:drug/metabolite transporter (DMT)-like permease
MYIPYRKAYISGMNPLSFVTVFTVGELGTVLALVLALDGGTKAAIFHSPETKHLLFWLFLGGFAWVIGDLFQQYAAKYLGIGRGIPLSNTNQMWGLAWGVFVFGEMAHADLAHKLLVAAGSLVMILGALAVSTAVATEGEHARTKQALLRECDRYGLDYDRVSRSYAGVEAGNRDERRGWWDYAIVGAAVGVFVYLGVNAEAPALGMNLPWLWVMATVLMATALGCGWGLWKATRFS